MSGSVKDRLRHTGWVVIVAVLVAVVVLTVVFSHGIRVRLIWGASGFAAGLVCGVLLTLEARHAWRKRKERHNQPEHGR